MKTKIIATAGATALMLGAACVSAHEYSANVMLTSDYVWRGVSQTNEGAALQGGFDAGFDFGGYTGVWASNVDFGVPGSNIETDWYGGYAMDIGCSACSIDGRLTYYRYQGTPEFNFWEGQVQVTYQDLTVGLAYAPQFGGDAGGRLVGDDIEEFYPYANYSYALPGEVSLNLHGAYTHMDEHGYYESNTTQYWDWSAGVSKDVAGFTMAVTYYDTDMGEKSSDLETAQARIVFAISKSM